MKRSNVNLGRVLIILILLSLISCHKKEGVYVCLPCDLPCDELSFTAAGTCPHCSMNLVKKSDVEKEKNLIVNEIDIQEGSGVFLIEGGNGKEDSNIKVYYHRPANYKHDSRVLLVIPGAGRNGDSYRDAWVGASEQYGVLILSPMYAEEAYGFEAYHLCGLIKDSNLLSNIKREEGSNIVKLDEANIKYTVNANRAEWIFADFDRIFDLAANAINSKQTQYDIFGHSAGGQILHRFALFQQRSKVDRIVASNAGFYTLPDLRIEFPFGIKNTQLQEKNVALSFAQKLMLFIGELDNDKETGGTLLRSTSVDKQGLHRLARGKYFYNASKELAEEMNVAFNWSINIVPGVGHDHRGMGVAAAEFLYGSSRDVND